MCDKSDKFINETEAAFALTIFLTNLLIFVVLGAIVRVIYAAINENGEFYAFLRGGFLP